MPQEFGKKVTFLTLGCRVNQAESAVIEGTLVEQGVSVVSLDESPDVCVINTCTVTAKSDATSRHVIRRALKTGAHVIVTGCYAQRRPDEILKIDDGCSVVKSDSKLDIIDMVLGYHAEPVYSMHGRARPYLKVQDGCNFGCTYCAVPLARGRSSSIPLEKAVESASEMSRRGYHEIVLTGIHIGTYGRDLPEMSSIARLMKKILTATNISRIRLSSIEINEIDDEMTELLGDKRICRHLHIPLQSGSSKILGLMRRNYSLAEYIRKLGLLAERFNDIAFGTDIIAGFPAESDHDFCETLETLRRLPLSYMHIFPYSRRAGTAAADLKPQISNNIISLRCSVLKELNNGLKGAYALNHVNKILDIITEPSDEKGKICGTSSNYLKVEASASGVKPGSLVAIRSMSADCGRLKGMLIS